MEKVKRNSYIVIGDEEDGLEGVEQVLKVKNTGSKIVQPLHRQISCIQAVASQIDKCYGLSYDEILPLLKEFYGYEIINKEDMIEPCKYCIIDIYYNWEVYAQNNDYAKECDVLEVEGLRDMLKEIMAEEETLNNK